ncbi:MAG: DNA-directed RNA polymerase subunit D [Candidatus Nanoarchaeia archaeon]
MVDIKLVNQTEYEIMAIVDKTSPTFMNAIRRAAMFEVPVLAIEDVYFLKNSSALYDEIVAHRLGLIPLKTDLKSYNLPEECTCKGKLCAKCSVKITLKAKGPVTVFASDLKFKDPAVKPIYPDMPIAQLLENQELEFEAVAVLGKGSVHVKWCPGHVYYRGYPTFEVKEGDIKAAMEQIPEGILKKDGKDLEIADLTKWNESYEDILKKHGIKTINSTEKFIFTLESWGQLAPVQILTEAVRVLQDKLKEVKVK